MGSYGRLAGQVSVLAALVAAVAMAAAVLGQPSSALWVAVAGAVALGFFVVVSLRRRRDVMRLAAEVDEVLHEGRRIDFSCYREGDVATLSNELAKMVARLQRTADLLDRERGTLADALANISHQIRTPLTAMSLMVPAIERADDPDERRRLTRRLESMIERMGWLVTTLLRLARADAGALAVESAPVRAASAIQRATAPLEAAYDLRAVELVVQADDDATFQGDERWSAEALENIVKNCLEHTPSGGRVTVTAREDALATAIVVTDTGPGIAEEDLPHIFERFFRSPGDSAAAEGDDVLEGFGIGLSLAQALVAAQGGTLRASNDPAGGARFEMVFPKLVV